jgi:hypothetical protein
MIVLTSQDYNLITDQCCSCVFPDCEEPRKVCQSIGAGADLAWEVAIYNESLHKYEYFLVYNWDYADGGYSHRSYDQGYNVYFNGYPSISAAAISIAVETVEEDGPYSGEITISHSGLIDVPASQQAALNAIKDHIPWDSTALPFETDCNSSTTLSDPYAAVVDYIFSASYSRYRFGIPDGYTRSTYEIQWDEVFCPKDWLIWQSEYEASIATYNAYIESKRSWDTCILDGGEYCGDEPPTPPPFETPEPTRPSLIQSREFIYDGTNEFSEWFELPAPLEDGENRVVNVLVKCYKYSAHGVKPKSFGQVIKLD